MRKLKYGKLISFKTASTISIYSFLIAEDNKRETAKTF